MDQHSGRQMATSRQRSERSGHPTAARNYDLLACLADAAAAAPLMVDAGNPQRQVFERCSAGQAGPTAEAQVPARRRDGHTSPSPPADLMTAGANTGLPVEREVAVTCNGTLGTFLLPSQTVHCHCARCTSSAAVASSATNHPNFASNQAPAITPTEFERHSGLLTAKKWRNSIRLVQGDGSITIGKWLEQQNILPRPKCSGGPLGTSHGQATIGISTALYGHHGNVSFGMDMYGHLAAGSGLSSANDGLLWVSAHGGCEPSGPSIPALRSTLPPSRYPASEYVTGDDDEFEEEAAAQLRRGSYNMDGGDGAAEMYDDPPADDDEDYDEGPFLDGMQEGGAPAIATGRQGRRVGTQRAARTGGVAGPAAARGEHVRGQYGRTAGGRPLASAGNRSAGQVGRPRLPFPRHHPGRGGAGSAQWVRAGAGAAAAAGSGGGVQLRRAGLGGRGVVGEVPRRAGGRGGGGGSIPWGAQGVQGQQQQHSSSEGSPPPSDDSKRGRDGSGGSGEGDGSGTGDGGDSRRLAGPGRDGEGRNDDDRVRPAGPLRAAAHLGAPSGAKNQPQPTTQPPTSGREERKSSLDGGGFSQERTGRQPTTATLKRPAPQPDDPPEMDPEPTHKRARRNRAPVGGPAPSGAPSGPLGGEASEVGEEMAALYDMGAVAASPLVRGWRFLGPSAGPAADQVLISVTINGRVYTGLLAPQQSVPPPPPAPAAMGRPPLVALAAATSQGPFPLASRKPGAGQGQPGAAPVAARCRPPTGHVSRATSGALEETEAVKLTCALGPLADGPVPLTPAPPAPPEDPPPDDGAPPGCPRCALCHRCAIPQLLLPAPPSSPSIAGVVAKQVPQQPPVLAVACEVSDALAPAAHVAMGEGAMAVLEAAAATTTIATATSLTDAIAHSPLILVKGDDVEAAVADAGAAALMMMQEGPSGTTTDTESRFVVQTAPTAPLATAAVSSGEASSCGSELIPAAAAATAVSSSSEPPHPPATKALQQAEGATGIAATTTTTIAAASLLEADARTLTSPVPRAASGSPGTSPCGALTDAAAAAATGAATGTHEGGETVKLEEEGRIQGVEVKKEAGVGGPRGNLLTPAEVMLMPPAGEGPTEAAFSAAAAVTIPVVPEASRSVRQAACGLGPLVEVRCAGEGGAAASTVAVVHSQCALWSPDVFVIGGAMYGVAAVVKRSRTCRCARCGRSGATLSCCSAKCGRVYHLPCAIEAGASVVAEPYSMACPDHRNAAAAYPTASQPSGRAPAARLRPSPSQAASQSTTTTTTTTAAVPDGTTSDPQLAQTTTSQHQPQHPLMHKQQQRVALPASLQMASGRRVVLPPLPAAAATTTAAADTAAVAANRTPHSVAHPSSEINSSLPALMMLRTQSEGATPIGSRAGVGIPQPAPAGSMPPPKAASAAAAAAAAGGSVGESAADRQHARLTSERGVSEREEVAAAPATGKAPGDAEREADTTVEVKHQHSLSPSYDVSSVPLAGATTGAPAWTSLPLQAPRVFERRQATLATTPAPAASTAAGGSEITHPVSPATGLSGVPAGSPDVPAETMMAMAGASECTTLIDGGDGSLKRKRDANGEEVDVNLLPVHDMHTTAAAITAAVTAHGDDDGDGPAVYGTVCHGAAGHPFMQRSTVPCLLASTGTATAPLGVSMGMGMGIPGMFLSRGISGTDLGDMSTDPASSSLCGYPTPASALAFLQHQMQLQQHVIEGASGMPEGFAMLLQAQGQKAGSVGGGDCSVGSPFTAQPARGGNGTAAGGRQHRGQPFPYQQHHSAHAAAPGTSGNTLSVSTGTALGRAASSFNGRNPSGSGGGAGGSGGGGSSGGGDESPTAMLSGGGSGGGAPPGGGERGSNMMHVLPRAARNIGGLLPSRPLLHNPYVPSSGDPSADLMLSKIAQNGSREVEAELLGGTTGRAGHTGRCAVCVIQRKGKCGTDSAPKKCLRRQLVALQRATSNQNAINASCGGGGGGSTGAVGVSVDDTDEPMYGDPEVATGATTLFMMDERVVAAAEQRARERARRETWSLPLGQGSGATGKRPPQHFTS